ncbi:MAG: hypothetical protein J0M02_17360, partial [Planctomycetes bacterium]|nr:hypothetical protein [Planctomycetota bacterium]
MLPDARTFTDLRSRWRAAWPMTGLLACRPDGAAARGRHPGGPPQQLAAQAVAEALRWGEPCVIGAAGMFCWAVPVMHNALVTGGLVAWIAETAL